MANLRILVPEATTNYITNPAMRFDTTGWSSSGSTLSRSLDNARFGIASLKVVTAGTAMREGAYFRVNNLSGMSVPVSVSVYVRGAGRVRLRLIDNPRGKEWSTAAIALSATQWTRLEVSGFSTGSNDMRLYVETDGAARAVTFYVDGAQMETKAYATSYCDGDQPGCRWNVIAHNSLSTRDAYTRQGGRWVALAGTCREDDNLYVTSLGGLGMAGVVNNVQAWASAPGAYHQSTKIPPRQVTLAFHAKNVGRYSRKPRFGTLHELRQQLIDLLKPDKTQGDEAFLFEYAEGDRPLYLWMRYEAGLEGEWDIRNPRSNSFPVRFVAVEPMFVEDNYNVQQLEFYREIGAPASAPTNYSFVARRANGEWESPAGGGTFFLNDEVKCMVAGPKGEIYAGGDFNIGGVTRIAKWNGTTWETLGPGGANGTVHALAVGPSGELYAGGAFTTIGGVSVDYIAVWNGTTWAQLAGGGVGYAPSSVKALAISENKLYVGGDFTKAGVTGGIGGIDARNIASWSNGTWGTCRGIGDHSLNNAVYALVFSNGKIYAGGRFTGSLSSIIAYDYVCVINTLDNSILQIPGFNYYVYALAASSDGKIYAGGAFTELKFSGTSGGEALRIAEFSGGSWKSMGYGFSGTLKTVRSVAVDKNGTVYAGGDYDFYSLLYPLRSLARWNGLTWVNLDVIPNRNASAPTVSSILPLDNGDLFIGMDGITTKMSTSVVNTVYNYGTAEVRPTLYVRGFGILRSIENLTTGQRVSFYSGIGATDEVFVDFAKGTMISPNRGNVLRDLVRDGDFQGFTLIPGENKIALYITNTVSATAQIGYTPTHWSADAVVDAEEL